MTKSFLLRLLRVAYSHPALSYPFHVLLVPKKPIPTPLAPPARAGVSALDPVSAFLPDVIATAQGLVEQFHLPACRLIVNGGEYQDFPYLHFPDSAGICGFTALPGDESPGQAAAPCEQG